MSLDFTQPNPMGNVSEEQAFQEGINSQRLADIQQDLIINNVMSNQYREQELRFGAPAGVQILDPEEGNIVNGGDITNTFQANNSVF